MFTFDGELFNKKDEYEVKFYDFSVAGFEKKVAHVSILIDLCKFTKKFTIKKQMSCASSHWGTIVAGSKKCAGGTCYGMKDFPAVPIARAIWEYTYTGDCKLQSTNDILSSIYSILTRDSDVLFLQNPDGTWQGLEEAGKTTLGLIDRLNKNTP